MQLKRVVNSKFHRIDSEQDFQTNLSGLNIYAPSSECRVNSRRRIWFIIAPRRSGALPHFHTVVWLSSVDRTDEAIEVPSRNINSLLFIAMNFSTTTHEHSNWFLPYLCSCTAKRVSKQDESRLFADRYETGSLTSSTWRRMTKREKIQTRFLRH